MAVIRKDDDVRIEKLELGPYGTNAYVVVDPGTGDSLLIDAPAEASVILESLKDTKPKYILLTHNHFDHTGALAEVRSKLGIPLGAHPLDADELPVGPDIRLEDGDVISCGGISFEVLHTPGHTPGSLSFKYGSHLFAGDTIFPGGPGKTRSPAKLKQLINSITEKILTLPDDTQIYPGHGATTTVKQAKEEFTAFSSRSHDPDLCGDVLWLSS
ncbi:MBL fold metallo-hydrolase [Chloroflexota bacterium]